MKTQYFIILVMLLLYMTQCNSERRTSETKAEFLRIVNPSTEKVDAWTATGIEYSLLKTRSVPISIFVESTNAIDSLVVEIFDQGENLAATANRGLREPTTEMGMFIELRENTEANIRANKEARIIVALYRNGQEISEVGRSLHGWPNL